ncbi:MAG: hypothetical protein IT204_03800 [Fimbriimonadaceae bacterium]|nr:hypothetical protein [Fimbriimonadaceae bacterium]
MRTIWQQRRGLLVAAVLVGLATVSGVLAQGGNNNGGEPGGPAAGGRPWGGDGGPMRGMMLQTQICATDDFVYIIRGNMLYQYSALDLKLLNKATLETPEMPQLAGRGGRPEAQPGGNAPAQ